MTHGQRILHVFPSFEMGGAQIRLARMAARLGPAFHHTVLSIHPWFGARSLLSEGVETARAPEANDIFGRLGAYRAEIAKRAPDVLVTYNWGAIEWAAANLISGKPHVHIVDGFGPDEAHGQLRRRVWARRLLLRNAVVVAPSLKLQQMAVNDWRLPAQNVVYIPNGVEARDRYDVRLEDVVSDLPPGRVKFVWAGAMRLEKNLLRLIRAFAPLHAEATLLLIGDGPEREVVEREVDALGITGSVRFLGMRNDARQLMMQCDVLVLSSDTEQMPLTVLEAMDAGLPVASTDVGDVSSMVAPANRPFVVELSDEALGGALQRLARDQLLRFRLGVANRQRARAEFSMARMCDAYRALFNGCSRRC